MDRYLITLSNCAGILDQRTANSSEECRNAALDLIAGMNDLHPGDRIEVIDRQPD